MEDLTRFGSLKMPDDALVSKINSAKRKLQNTDQDYEAFMNVSKSTTKQDSDDQSREDLTLEYSDDSVEDEVREPDDGKAINHFRTSNVMKTIMVDDNHYIANDMREREHSASTKSRASTVKKIIDNKNVEADDVPETKDNTARGFSRRSTVTNSATQSSASRLSRQGPQLSCDVCEIDENFASVYCSTCCQKMCEMCNELHGRYGGSFDHPIDSCSAKSTQIDAPLLVMLKDQHGLSFRQMVCYLNSEIGLQICANYLRDTSEILAPNPPVLELAIDTIRAMAENRLEGDKDECEVRETSTSRFS